MPSGSMEESQQPLGPPAETQGNLFSTLVIELIVTLELAAGMLRFEWKRPGETVAAATLK